MSKKAYLVDFSICSRVEAEDENTAIILAVKKILTNPSDYICGDNCTNIEEDWEVPIEKNVKKNS